MRLASASCRVVRLTDRLTLTFESAISRARAFEE